MSKSEEDLKVYESGPLLVEGVRNRNNTKEILIKVDPLLLAVIVGAVLLHLLF